MGLQCAAGHRFLPNYERPDGQRLVAGDRCPRRVDVFVRAAAAVYCRRKVYEVQG